MCGFIGVSIHQNTQEVRFAHSLNHSLALLVKLMVAQEDTDTQELSLGFALVAPGKHVRSLLRVFIERHFSKNTIHPLTRSLSCGEADIKVAQDLSWQPVINILSEHDLFTVYR
jgi:hypothetical protein